MPRTLVTRGCHHTQDKNVVNRYQLRIQTTPRIRESANPFPFQSRASARARETIKQTNLSIIQKVNPWYPPHSFRITNGQDTQIDFGHVNIEPSFDSSSAARQSIDGVPSAAPPGLHTPTTTATTRRRRASVGRAFVQSKDERRARRTLGGRAFGCRYGTRTRRRERILIRFALPPPGEGRFFVHCA